MFGPMFNMTKEEDIARDTTENEVVDAPSVENSGSNPTIGRGGEDDHAQLPNQSTGSSGSKQPKRPLITCRERERRNSSAGEHRTHKRTPSSSSTHASGKSNQSASRSSSGSTQEKEFTRGSLEFDPDLYLCHPSFSDFMFYVGREEIGLSTIILAANSNYIRNKVEKEKCTSLDLSILNLDKEQILEMVRPLYSGRLTLNSKNLLQYLSFSTQYEFTWVSDCCVQYFTENIKPDLVFDFLEIGLSVSSEQEQERDCSQSYSVVIRLCTKYLEEGGNLAATCNYIKEGGRISRLSQKTMDFLCKIENPSSIEVISLLLAWIKKDDDNMAIVPGILDSFDFGEIFKQNEELAEMFFTHIIAGDYSAETRIKIMNLTFQCYKHLNTKSKSKFRMTRLKSTKQLDGVDKKETG